MSQLGGRMLISIRELCRAFGRSPPRSAANGRDEATWTAADSVGPTPRAPSRGSKLAEPPVREATGCASDHFQGRSPWELQSAGLGTDRGPQDLLVT